MQTMIQHESGIILSIKTFRPLWIFPWLSSIWRQLPMRTCIATVSYDNRRAAEEGHKDLGSILKSVKIGPDMREIPQAVKEFAEKRSGAGVKSCRVYPGHALEGKFKIDVNAK